MTFEMLNLPSVLPMPGRGFKKTIDANWDDLKAAQHRLDETAMAAQRIADEFGIAIARLRGRMEDSPGRTVGTVIDMVNRNRKASA